MLIPFIVKVSVLGYSPLSNDKYKLLFCLLKYSILKLLFDQKGNCLDKQQCFYNYPGTCT